MNKRGATILVVDDEQEIVRALQRNLTAHGYSVLVARSGEEAVDITARRHPDLLLLDLLLPGMSGIEVCRRVRAESNVPIIVLSVKDAQYDKVEALDLGADDYVPKPFGIDELLARIRVALRHVAQPSSGVEPRFELGPLSVELDQRRVEFEGHEVALTPTEYELLKVFITHRGKILTRMQLIKEVWDEQAYSRAHSLHVQVTRLRHKIEPEPEHPRLIRTIPGVGYRFADERELSAQVSAP